MYSNSITESNKIIANRLTKMQGVSVETGPGFGGFWNVKEKSAPSRCQSVPIFNKIFGRIGKLEQNLRKISREIGTLELRNTLNN